MDETKSTAYPNGFEPSAGAVWLYIDESGTAAAEVFRTRGCFTYRVSRYETYVEDYGDEEFEYAYWTPCAFTCGYYDTVEKAAEYALEEIRVRLGK